MTGTTKQYIRRSLALTGFRARLLAVLAIAGLATAACDVHGVVDVGTAQSISVAPNATLMPGATQQMVAVARDADGRVVNVTPTWTVVAGGGTISSTGLFTAGTAPGAFANTVSATSGTLSATASITVIPGPLSTIVVTPNPVTLAVTTTQQFTAVGKDASGNIVAFVPTWSIVATGGSISSAGVFTAGTTPGTFTNTVQASNQGLTGRATVVVTAGPLATIAVTPNPATLIVSAKQQFVATGRDASGNVVTTSPIWSVVAAGGSIDGAGLFTAGATPGLYANTVKATSGTISATATVLVTAGPLATIRVTPNPVTLAVGSIQQFTAVGTDIAGNVVVITPVWDIATTPNGASVTLTGQYTVGTLTGTFPNKLRATSGGISGYATIIVTAGPLASIVVTPNPVFVRVNETQQFTAVGYDASGNVFIFKPVWSVVNGGGTIDTVGLFTAGGTQGPFLNTVRAVSGATQGMATVVVTAPPPPPPPAIPPPPPAPSPLGTAANFGIISGAAIRCGTPGTPGSVSGATSAANIGSGNNTYVGFPPGGPCTLDGIIPAAGVIATAAGDLTTAYLAAQGILGCTNLSGIDLGFYNALNPLPPGTYCFSTSAQLTGTLQLTGAAGSRWTFQIGSTLTAAVNSVVNITGGAVADNVYWAVGSSATLGTTSSFSGNIMSLAAITLNAGAVLNGRALAQTAGVDMILGGSVIIKP